MLRDDADDLPWDEDPFIPNPNYVPNAGMNLSGRNAEFLMETIGFVLDDQGIADFDIDAVHKATLKALNNKTRSGRAIETSVDKSPGKATFIDCGTSEGYTARRLVQLLAIIVEGRKRGATHLCVC